MPHKHAPNPEQLEGEALAAWKRAEQERHEREERENEERRTRNAGPPSKDPITQAYLGHLAQDKEENA